MKKLLSICLALLLVAGLAVIPTGADAAAIEADTTSWYGDGTADVFELDSAADFLGFFKKVSEGVSFAGKTVALTADIDLNPGWDATTMVNATNRLTQLSTNRFCGTFDGRGFSVSGICATVANDSGIFGQAAAGDDVTIQNVRFLNSYVAITAWRCAALMAVTGGGKVTIKNVYSEMTCKGRESGSTYGSAFVTTAYQGTGEIRIENSVYAGKISEARQCGAFIGQFYNGTATLKNCAFYGVMEDAPETGVSCSGLVYDNRGTLTVENCISAGTVSANTGGNVNSIIMNAGGTYTAKNNLYTEEKTGSASQKGATRVTAADLADFYAWNEANPDAGFSSWDVIDGKAYPTTLAWKVKGANSEAVCLKNWQKTAVTDGKWAVRLLGGVDTLDYEKLELRLTVRNAEGKTATRIEEIAKVYSAILADGETHTAASLETAYIWAVVLEDIPEAQTAVDLGAAVYTVKDGVKTLVSVHSVLIGGAEQ